MISDQEYTRRMVRTVLTVAGVAAGAALLYAARDALMLVYISALAAMGFSPLVTLLERPARGRRRRLGLSRVLAILTIYVTILGVLVVLALMVVPPLVDQTTTLWSNAPDYFSRFQQVLIDHRLLTHQVTLQEAVQNTPVGAGTNAVGTLLGALWSVVGGVFGLTTIAILSFYLLIEAKPLFTFATRLVPEPDRAAFAATSIGAVDKVSAWLRAQLTLAGVMGVCAAVGLAIIGVPYYFVVAMVAACGETIPMVGPVIGGATAVAVALTVSPKLALAAGLYFLALHQLEVNILVPKLMERQVGVSPVAVIIALLVGAALWGLLGAILAVPTAAILSVVLDEYTARHARRAIHRAAQ